MENCRALMVGSLSVLYEDCDRAWSLLGAEMGRAARDRRVACASGFVPTCTGHPQITSSGFAFNKFPQNFTLAIRHGVFLGFSTSSSVVKMAGSQTGKRKREEGVRFITPNKKPAVQAPANGEKPAVRQPNGQRTQNGRLSASQPDISKPTEGTLSDLPVYVQIVTGSYERVLHGICATIPRPALEQNDQLTQESNSDSSQRNPGEQVTFTDTFLQATHTSAIRCLAISPPSEADQCLLATGGSDERINVYTLSTVPPTTESQSKLPSSSGVKTAENSRNQSLGSLVHHDRAISRLQFPTKSKLFSAAEDNTICISRSRDWTVLSSIKAPIPKSQGRPSGDTATPGDVPAGVNDFAIHPSQKLMLSVGRGERCMRLWNLMTGKKAGVLNFDRELLAQIGESKFSSGEGQRVLWDGAGENFVVGFERGAMVFGIDSKPKAIIRTSPPSKIHQMHVVDGLDAENPNVLSISTEDGRILFFNVNTDDQLEQHDNLPQCACIGQLGGAISGTSGRIKDFEILTPPAAGKDSVLPRLLVTGYSTGTVRLWKFFVHELLSPDESHHAIIGNGDKPQPRQVGEIIGTLETNNRVTCLGAFILNGTASQVNGGNLPEENVKEGGSSEEAA